MEGFQKRKNLKLIRKKRRKKKRRGGREENQKRNGKGKKEVKGSMLSSW